VAAPALSPIAGSRFGRSVALGMDVTDQQYGEEAMWMRSCAVCKALMMKLRLRDCVRCRCGWEWEW
jgi:hypothetical protein